MRKGYVSRQGKKSTKALDSYKQVNLSGELKSQLKFDLQLTPLKKSPRESTYAMVCEHETCSADPSTLPECTINRLSTQPRKRK